MNKSVWFWFSKKFRALLIKMGHLNFTFSKSSQLYCAVPREWRFRLLTCYIETRLLVDTSNRLPTRKNPEKIRKLVTSSRPRVSLRWYLR